MSKLKIAILFGGVSNEHDVSLVSATNIINSISPEKYEVIPIGITKKGRWFYYPGDISLISSGRWDSHPDCVPCAILPDPIYGGIVKFVGGEATTLKVDAVFPAVHGKNCEDGALQGLLKLSGIPFVGSGCHASACCMDKATTHQVLEYNGIKMAKWHLVKRSELGNIDAIIENIEAKITYPMFVKPANSGSSVGVNRAQDAEDLKNAIKLAFAHDRKVIVEESIIGRELECAVLGNDDPFASGVGEIISDNGFYDYDSKYILNNTSVVINADLDATAKDKIREIAVKAYKDIGCEGLSRIDFFYTKEGEIYLNEINNLPGFTPISMYPKLMEELGISANELIDRLITLALER